MTETLTLLEELFSESGAFVKTLPNYESRLDQQKMAKEIWTAFEQEKHALFEAGTGIGKTLAYLIPSLIWSYRTGEKVVISTYTISLQEQLLEKDIPLLLDALGLDLRIVLAKGMGNYLCLRKLEENGKQPLFLDSSADILADWARKTKEGSRSSLPSTVTNEVWKEVYAESEGCSYMKCPHYKQCFFFKARSKVQDADVIIVNHHLLMSHLLAEENKAILPFFDRLVIDEAHHFEQVARTSLSRTIDRIDIFKRLARIHSDTHPEVSRLYFIRDLLKKNHHKKLEEKVGKDLPAERRDLTNRINQAFDLLEQMAFENRYKWRIPKRLFETNNWSEDLIPRFIQVKEGIDRYVASLDHLQREIPEELKEKTENALLDIQGASEKLKELSETIEEFFSDEEFDSQVRWGEKTPEGPILSFSPLDVASFLEEKLFTPLKSGILCSATLSVDDTFEHVKETLGIKKKAIEKIYHSPFDFQTRTRLFGFSDLPPPNSLNFIEESSKVIRKAIEISRGGAFVLFTSYEMLNKCAEALSDLPVIKQGEGSRHLLLEEFKAQKNGILFGTDSFWEGVDVAGEALRLVIIVKLPFPVPTEPLVEARAEYLKKLGKEPFLEDSLPQAVMKFKQGFGRLMRRKEDRGCVLCLDQRLFKRSYGKTFLKSLPECLVSFQKTETIYQEMEMFY